jgi:hypothetical protein
MPPLRSILLVTLLAVSGCQPHPPSFLSRVREDAAGARWACDLLDSFAHPRPVSSPHAGGDALAPQAMQLAQRGRRLAKDLASNVPRAA